MIWAINSLITKIIENFLLAYTLEIAGIILVLPLFYLATFLFFLPKLIKGHKFTHLCLLNKNEFQKYGSLLVMCIAGSVIGNGLWFTSVTIIGIGQTTILILTTHILVHIYAYFFFDEKHGFISIASIIITLFGLFLFFTNSQNTQEQIGIILSMIASLCFATETITKKKISNLIPEKIMFIRQVIHFIFFFIFCATLIFIQDISILYLLDKISSWFIFIIIITAGAGYFTNFFSIKALQELPVSYCMMISSLKPIILMVLGIIFLNEHINETKIIASLVITASVILFFASRKKN